MESLSLWNNYEENRCLYKNKINKIKKSLIFKNNYELNLSIYRMNVM